MRTFRFRHSPLNTAAYHGTPRRCTTVRPGCKVDEVRTAAQDERS